MKIALLADTRKSELLVNFCLAYSYILSKHELVSFFNTARLLETTARLVARPLVGNNSAGLGQIASSAMYDEIDAVIYLRDPALPEYDDPNPLQKACDFNNIPYAGSLATAEILVLAIENGDLDWRQLLH